MGSPSGSFEREWPILARRVDGALAQRQVAPWLREDIVQETGLRLFRMWESIDPHRSVRALAITIAVNLLRDEARKWERRPTTAAIPERAAEDDVERESIARLEFQEVQGALRHLSPAQRAVLLAEVGAASPPDVSPDAVRMLRMRARRRLNELVDRAAAFGGAISTEARRILDRVSSNSSRHAPASEGFAGAFVALSAIALLGISPFGPGATGPDPPQSVEVAVVPGTVWAIPADLEIAPAERAEGTFIASGSTDSSKDVSSASDESPGRVRNYGVSVADDDGPASVEASISVGDSGDDGDTTKPPSCTADPSGLPTSVAISCRASTPTHEVAFTVRAEVRPPSLNGPQSRL